MTAPAPSSFSNSPASLDRRFLLGGLAGVAGVSALAGMARGGPINPPAGPVASTPGPEPRTAVNATNTPGNAAYAFRITQPGSYYLAGNVLLGAGQSGIEITVGGVTLDLNGFTLQGNFDGTNASAVSGVVFTGGGGAGTGGLTIANGQVNNWGQTGVRIEPELAGPVVLRNLSVFAAGAIGIDALCPAVRLSDCTVRGCVLGAQLGPAALVERCTAHGNATRGFLVGNGSTLSDVVALANNGPGILAADGCTLLRCAASGNGQGGIAAGSSASIVGCVCRQNVGSGVSTGANSIVEACASETNTSHGFSFTAGCTIHGCSAGANGAVGISVVNNCLVESCTCNGNGGGGIAAQQACTLRGNQCSGHTSPGAAGILLSFNGNRVEGNSCTGNSRGFWAQSAGNIFLRNTAQGNVIQWSAVSGNYLQVVTPAAAPSLTGSTGGAALAASGYDPNVNFTL